MVSPGRVVYPNRVMNETSPFLEAAVRTATPLIIASLGETVAERAGVINIGLEGCIIAGAYAAFIVGASSVIGGYAAAAFAGCVIGLLLVILVVVLRRDQIIVGTALTMLALGVTGTLFRARGTVTPMIVTTEGPTIIPIVSKIPVLGAALFAQPAITYVGFLLVPMVWWWLRRTHSGLALRAVGESPSAARAAGISVAVIQSFAVLFASTMGGLAGGCLVLAQAGTFAEGMSAGRGFLAIAIVALGQWQVAGTAMASLVFGAAMAVQFAAQAAGWQVRYELVLMIPYVLTLAALGAFARGSAPAMLGRSLSEE